MKGKILFIGLLVLVIALSGCLGGQFNVNTFSGVVIPCDNCSEDLSKYEDCKPFCEKIFSEANAPLTEYIKVVVEEDNEDKIGCECKGHLEDWQKIDEVYKKYYPEG